MVPVDGPWIGKNPWTPTNWDDHPSILQEDLDVQGKCFESDSSWMQGIDALLKLQTEPGKDRKVYPWFGGVNCGGFRGKAGTHFMMGYYMNATSYCTLFNVSICRNILEALSFFCCCYVCKQNMCIQFVEFQPQLLSLQMFEVEDKLS